MALHCTECGFVNAEGANYCQKCGAFLGAGESADEPTTSSYRIGETGEQDAIEIEPGIDVPGASLVIRSGGGRAGEVFPCRQ